MPMFFFITLKTSENIWFSDAFKGNYLQVPFKLENGISKVKKQFKSLKQVKTRAYLA